MPAENSPADYVLTLDRVIQAPVANLWRCWTEPELLERWFCPKPWYVTNAHINLEIGGAFSTTMNGPDGEQFDTMGVFLAIEPQQRLITTDAFCPGWIPSARAFTTTEVCFKSLGASTTRYTARAMHWDQAAQQEHEQMGFHDGWAAAADQLEALAKSLNH